MTSHRERARAFMPSGDPDAYKAWVEGRKQAARQAENERNISMGRYKTQRGDSVDMPDGTSALRDQTDTTYQTAVEAFDAIQEVKARNAAMSQASGVDRSRFPALEGDQR